MIAFIAKIDIFKSHIPAQPHQFDTAIGMWVLPRPFARIFLTCFHCTIRMFMNAGQGDQSIIHFRYFFHHFKDTLSPRHRRQNKIKLLGKGVDRHCRLTDKYQIAG